MASYKRLSIAGHGRPARPLQDGAPAHVTRVRDPHDAQPMQGVLLGVPLGLACWAALGGIGLLVAQLIG